MSSPEIFYIFVVVQWAIPLARGGTLRGSHHTIYLQAATAATPFFFIFLKDRGNAAKCNKYASLMCLCQILSKIFHLERVNWNLQILLHNEKNIIMKTIYLRLEDLIIYLFIVECSNAIY